MYSESQQVADALQLYHVISEKSNDPISFDRLNRFINQSACPNTKKVKKKVQRQQYSTPLPNSGDNHVQQQQCSNQFNANDVLQVLKYNSQEKQIDFIDFYSYYQKIAMKAQLNNENTIFSVIQHVNGSGKILIQDLLKVINQLQIKMTLKELTELLQNVTGESNVTIVTTEMLLQVVEIFYRGQ